MDSGDIEALKSVFTTCDVNARGDYYKQTALAYAKCPDELARWLVDQGADISAEDKFGDTPLHACARREKIEILLELGADVHKRSGGVGDTPLHMAVEAGNIHNARVLLEHGARADALNSQKLTPLAYALYSCRNADIEQTAAMAEFLLDAQPQCKGDDQTFAKMQDSVRRIGEEFEFHRSNFNPEHVDATSAGLDKLYSLFDVRPVPRRVRHDGKSPIIVKAEKWGDRHQELWELLVPSSGHAATVQGEVIRISGRIDDEIQRNGGVNWGPEYKKMGDAFLRHINSGVALGEAELVEAGALVKEIKRGGDCTARLCELAVNWVVLNPEPVTLPKPNYQI